jgi:transposase
MKDLRDRTRAIEKAERIVKEQSHNQLNEKRGYKKYITTTSNSEDKKDKSASVLQIDKERIERESRFDGYSAIEYSREDLSAEEVIEQYHKLYKIEESFRILKSTMRTRPIYLRTREHIEGHFVICFFAFLLERELELRLRRRQIEFSSEKIKKALNTVEFSEVEIEGQKYYLKGKQDKLSSEIFSLLRIKQPRHLLSKEEALEYINQ